MLNFVKRLFSKKEDQGIVVLTLYGAIDHKLATEVAGAIAASGGKPVMLNINSIGGVFNASMAIIDAMERHGNVHTHNMGSADSTASLIFAAGKHRTLGKRATCLIHEVRYIHNDGSLEFEADEGKMSGYLKKNNKMMALDFSRFSDGNAGPKKIRRLMEEETLLSAEELIRLGLADEII